MSDLIAETGAEAPAADAAAEPLEPLADGAAAGDVAEVEPVAADPAPSGFDPRDAELEHLRGQYDEVLGALNELVQSGVLQTPAGGQQQQDPLASVASQLTDEFGNLNPAALTQFLSAQQQATVQAIGQQLAPLVDVLTGQQEQAVQQKGEDNLTGMLEDNVARHGEFASTPQADAEARQLVRTLAEQQFPEVAARYGNNPRAAEIAMNQAAEQVRGLLRAAGAEGATRHANQMATLAGAAADAGPGSAAGVQGAPAFNGVGDVVAYYSQKAREL